MEKTIGKSISILNHLLVQKLNNLLYCQKTGITSDQFRLLTFLWEKDGISQQILVNLLSRDKASIARMVDLLEDTGILTRISDKTDKRVNLIYLTKKGKQLKFQAIFCAQSCNNMILNNFNENEKTEFERLILKAIYNLVKAD